jgi:hypothetical protein
VRIDLVFERNTSCNLSVSGGSRLCLIQIGLFSWGEEIHVSLQRKPSMLEVATSSTRIHVRLEYVLKGIFPANLNFQVGESLILFKEDYSVELRKHIYLSTKTVCMRNRSISNIVSLWEWRQFLKWTLPANHSFQCGDRLYRLQVGVVRWAEETHVSLQRKPSMLKRAESSTLFPSENWVGFGK